MAFEGLSEKLGGVFKRLKSRGKLTESDVREAMREVKMALLEADVSYKERALFSLPATFTDLPLSISSRLSARRPA